MHAGAYGAKNIATPAFDRVAREGMLFRNSFSACPSCTPSRSAVLSGRHIWQVKEAGVLYGAMPPELPLYTHLLEDAGYFVGFTGKGWAPGDWQAQGLKRNPCGREFNSRKHASPVPVAIDDRDYAANFSEFLAANSADAPFCFWFGSTEPHRLYDTGRGLRVGKRLEDVDVPAFLPDVPEVRSDLLDYIAEIEWFDQQLAKILRQLDESGQAENTLVVVTSDNGMPFPRAKVNLYDWGVRMPLALRWPGRVSGDQVVERLVSHIDFAPTFLEAAGVPVPKGMIGTSLLSASGERDVVFTGMERHTMCRPDGATYPMRAIRTKRHLYIRNFAPDRWPTGGDFLSSNKTTHGDIDGAPTKDVLLGSTKHLLCVGKRPPEELYDVAADPDQVKNLATDPMYAAELERLRSRLEKYLRETGDPRIEGRDPWQAYTYHQTTGYGASFNKSLPDEVRRQAAGRSTHKPE
jgi:N-sulfoglucosamine sulfohydrolase